MKVVLVSDFLYSEIPGGAESNDDILKGLLEDRKHDVLHKKTNSFNELLASEEVNADIYIISNFYFISEEAKTFLSDKKYIIIEHDYKFLSTRNPAEHRDCIVPSDKIIHQDFYKGAVKVLVQSQLQLNIFNKNINLNNLENFSGNLWAERALEHLDALSHTNKNGRAAILDDDSWVKGKNASIQFCDRYQIAYDLIPKQEYFNFLTSLSRYSLYVFFPQTPETLSRVTLEAKMMNLSVITNEFTGAYHEDFYSLSGKGLIKKMWDKRDDILDIIEEQLKDGE